MNGYERTKKHLCLEEADRIGFYESTVWPETLERWGGEGYPEGVSPDEYFDFDLRRLRIYPTFGFEDVLIQDEGDRELRRDVNGNLYRIAKHAASAIEHVDYLIKTRDDWEAHQGRLAVTPARFDQHWIEGYAESRKREQYVFLSIRQPLWAAMNKVGLVRFMELMYDDREWLHEMLQAHLRFIFELLDLAQAREYLIDGVYLVNGTTSRKGSIISPADYWELGSAYDKILVDRLREEEKELMFHYDGNFWEVLDETIRSGVHGIGMIECRAGMDVVDLKKEAGDKLAFMGNIDVDVLATGDREAIEAEVRRKVSVAMEGGGYIYHSDGSIPPSVSFQDYMFAYDLAREIGRYG